MFDRIEAALNRALVSTARPTSWVDTLEDMQLGLPELRRAISQRYLERGYAVPMDEIMITCGGTEAISLSLQAVTKPGDIIVVDAPMFYSGVKLIEEFGLRPIEMPVDPEEGMDLGRLQETIGKYRVAACLLMTNCQNPVGFTISEAKKRELVRVLARHDIPLIENDVYHELQFGAHHVRAAKAFDQGGKVLHCGSFTKSLAPGYKVGWLAAGQFSDRVRARKFVSTLGTSIPPQRAIASYLSGRAHENHLRALRLKLFQQVHQMSDAVAKYFPTDTALSRPSGGYILWVQLPETCDAYELFERAAKNDIGIAPGHIFSAGRSHTNYVRLNCGHPWSPALEKTLKDLGATVAELSR